MARVCRAKSGRFKKCGSGGGKRKAKRRKGCKYGILKGTGKCRKTPKRRKRR
jgi:hypothetical protein